MKNKAKYYGRISIVLISVAAVIGLIVFGIYSIIDKVLGKGGETREDPETTQGTSDIDDEGAATPAPTPEDRNSPVSFYDNTVTVKNPGQNHDFSVTTGVNRLKITVKDRKTDLPGEAFETPGDLVARARTVEGQGGFAIEIDIKVPFTLDISEEGNQVSYTIREQKNHEVLSYRNDKDRVNMNIVGAVLCSECDSEKKYYSEMIDEPQKEITLRMPSENLPDLEDDILQLRDGYFEYIKITNTGNDLVMVFKYMEDLVIYPNTRGYDAAFTFIKPDMTGNLIVIDPGHGGMDGGAVSPDESIIEKDIVIKISQMLERELEDMGFEVYNLRKEDVYLGLMERTDIANILNAGMILSIHVNSYSDDTSVSGTVTLYKESYELATAVQRNVLQKIHSVDMGAVKRDDLSILNRAEMDALIIETGFITNELEAAKLTQQEYQESIAEGIAAGVMEYMESKDAG